MCVNPISAILPIKEGHQSRSFWQMSRLNDLNDLIGTCTYQGERNVCFSEIACLRTQ